MDLPYGLVVASVFLFSVVCIIMILVVLIQRPTGGGLSGAFGAGSSGGAGQTAFGAKTGDALTIATIGMFVIYLLFAVGLNFAARPADLAPTTPVVAPAEGLGGSALPDEDLGVGADQEENTADDADGSAPAPADTTGAGGGDTDDAAPTDAAPTGGDGNP